jgi:uncharacterized membrane protein YkvA (DUF1232 family)
MRILLITVGVAVTVWLLLILILALAGRRSAARELAVLIPNLILLFRGLLRDDRVPRASKLLLLFGVAWLVSPIDLIPEFLPVVGPLDDAIVAALLLRHVVRKAGRRVVSDHWRGQPATLEKILALARVPEDDG